MGWTSNCYCEIFLVFNLVLKLVDSKIHNQSYGYHDSVGVASSGIVQEADFVRISSDSVDNLHKFSR